MADVCPFVISPVTVDKSEPRPGALQLLAALRPEWNGDNITVEVRLEHDDVIKWKYIPRHWPFARGIHRSPVNSPHKWQ